MGLSATSPAAPQPRSLTVANLAIQVVAGAAAGLTITCVLLLLILRLQLSPWEPRVITDPTPAPPSPARSADAALA